MTRIREAEPRTSASRTADSDKSIGPTGHRYIDHGAPCDNAPGPGCFLRPDQRARMILDFKGRAENVQDSLAEALAQVRVDKLLEKQADLDWGTSMFLDLIGVGIVGSLLKYAAKAQALGLERIGRLASGARLGGDRHHWTLTFETALQGVTPQRLGSVVTMAVGKGRKQAEEQLKDEEVAQQVNEKTESVNFLDHLRTETASAFQRIREQTPAETNDAELLQLFEAFAIEFHQATHYAKVFADKLRRFEESGVTAIGRKNARRTIGAMGAYEFVKLGVTRDTRLVWHTYASGYPKQLVYEFHDGEPVINLDDLSAMASKTAPGKFGPRAPLTASPEVGKVVPAEFHAIALRRHEQMWGGSPRTELIDDSNSNDPFRIAAAARNQVLANSSAESSRDQ